MKTKTALYLSLHYFFFISNQTDIFLRRVLQEGVEVEHPVSNATADVGAMDGLSSIRPEIEAFISRENRSHADKWLQQVIWSENERTLTLHVQKPPSGDVTDIRINSSIAAVVATESGTMFYFYQVAIPPPLLVRRTRYMPGASSVLVWIVAVSVDTATFRRRAWVTHNDAALLPLVACSNCGAMIY